MRKIVYSFPVSSVVDPFFLQSGERISRAFSVDANPHRLSGVHSLFSLGLLLANPSQERLRKHPHLVILPDDESCESFRQSVAYFDPRAAVHILRPFDVGIYSNLYPSRRAVSSRLGWVYSALNAKPGEIFVSSIEALSQRTMPFDYFAKNHCALRRGSEFHEPSSFLHKIGYESVPTVEDPGTFSVRGGILDVFSPAHPNPVRIEFFGDIVETIRFFDPKTQISLPDPIDFAAIIPSREIQFTDDSRARVAAGFKQITADRDLPRDEISEILRSITQGTYFYGADFLLPLFYDKLSSPLDYFSQALDVWYFDRAEILRQADELFRVLKNGFTSSDSLLLRVPYTDFYAGTDSLSPPEDSTITWIDRVALSEGTEDVSQDQLTFRSFSLREFSASSSALMSDHDKHVSFLKEKLTAWRSSGYRVFISTPSIAVSQKISLLLERAGFTPRDVAHNEFLWSDYLDLQARDKTIVHLVHRAADESTRLTDDHILFLRDQDIISKKRVSRSIAESEPAEDDRAKALSFGDLQVGDLVVHKIHGIGTYEGLRAMDIEGAPAEFIEVKYKDNDRLYLPVYRISQIQKYIGPSAAASIDKLGGLSWQKTKTKVRGELRDIAASLLSLYAKRAEALRPKYSLEDSAIDKFESGFPYQETPDQLKAIHDVYHDLAEPKPMDRLVCGDVGFGKTEVAMRAAFAAVHDHRQVAIIAPTTILTFQHFENFKRRFKNWPVEIRALNRFVSPKDVKEAVSGLSSGKVDIVIGTHRLLSKDIRFKNLGLLIIDEEQKFGVAHKERLRKLREAVDTLAMSATPIPRTLNMSLVGVRDLSLVNTPPEDRLPTRTFVCKFEAETIRRAIESEMARGGQIFFLHNRVQSIELAASKIREIVPHARLAVAHGQMDEHQLEKTMLKFFNHEVDVLVCTAIIESGMDIPKANTIFIDNAHTFGVSQLYQLRGRVGRSKERAYCYLLLPPDRKIEPIAHDRLKVIQENTALGSGLRVAQYDLELRGAGDMLGEDQSGHINAVGYELFIELLEEAIREQRGDAPKDEALEPELNLRIPALIPDEYIPDIRMRLYYYKALSQISSPEEMEKIEDELRDQFGKLPDPVVNLMGLMVIRKLCRDLGVRDVSSGKAFVSLSFTDKTRLPTQEVIRLTTKENKKYQLTPTQALKIRMNEITWPRVVEELEYLISLCGK